ncbi:winged helix-turn-helix transcriptional regulator [Burkholderia metallica]|uniref:winged helix-turn-helix transcriptional regulator n=1 Tax=Burkholderia metallica TaxID=488729 RepID=UPI001CF253CF|nr:response regulator transcription factor [Burkholderia metallica]MCA8003453.1 response regulator transcription factor [Burkholderia metallica]
MRIAIFTSNDTLFHQLNQVFEPNNTSCTRFTDELSLIRAVQRDPVQLAIFDAVTNPIPALATLEWRTSQFRSDPPMVIISRAWNCEVVLKALEVGIDEIVIGSTCVDEIMVRARSLLARRRGSHLADRLTVAGYTIDRAARSVSFDDRIITLTARELCLAWLLFTNAGTLMTREQLANAVWGKNADLAGRSLEQHIYKLRSKLALDKHGGPQLKTVYSLGYVLVDRAKSEVRNRGVISPIAA